MRAKSFDEIFRVDELSTTGVDDHHALLHLSDALRIDDVLRLRSEGAVEGDDVSISVERIKIYDFHTILLGKFVVGIKVVGHDAHAETMEDFDEHLRNLTHTNEPHSATIHVEAQESLQTEVTFARAVHGTINLTVETQHESNGIFSHSIGRVSRHVHHINATFCSFEIHIVESGTAQCDEFHTILHQFVDHLGVAFGIDKDAHHICSLSQGNCLERKVLLIVLDIETIVGVGGGKGCFVVGMTVEKCDFKCHNNCVFG